MGIERTAARPDGRPRPWLLVWWLTALVAAVWLFSWLGRGPLEAPPVADLQALAVWVEHRSAAEVFVSVLRLLVLALAWYLLGVTTFGLAARLLRAARLVALADVVTVPAVRRMLQSALGIGLAAAAVVSLPAAQTTVGGTVIVREASGEPHQGHGIATEATSDGQEPSGGHTGTPLPLLPIDGPDRILGAGEAERRDSRATERTDPWDAAAAAAGGSMGANRLEPEIPDTDGRPQEGQQPTGPDRSETEHAAADAESAADVGTGHTIAPGEHLWSIAEDALRAAWDRPPDDEEAAAYWRKLIELNRAVLPDPANPDLVHPGLDIRLPSPPPAPPPG